jgi:hypothetical protein
MLSTKKYLTFIRGPNLNLHGAGDFLYETKYVMEGSMQSDINHEGVYEIKYPYS